MTGSGVLVTTADVFRLYGVPAGTVRRWVAEGRLSQRVVGGRAWYRLDEVDELVGVMGRRLPRQRKPSE